MKGLGRTAAVVLAALLVLNGQCLAVCLFDNCVEREPVKSCHSQSDEKPQSCTHETLSAGAESTPALALEHTAGDPVAMVLEATPVSAPRLSPVCTSPPHSPDLVSNIVLRI